MKRRFALSQSPGSARLQEWPAKRPSHLMPPALGESAPRLQVLGALLELARRAARRAIDPTTGTTNGGGGCGSLLEGRRREGGREGCRGVLFRVCFCSLPATLCVFLKAYYYYCCYCSSLCSPCIWLFLLLRSRVFGLALLCIKRAYHRQRVICRAPLAITGKWRGHRRDGEVAIHGGRWARTHANVIVTSLRCGR